MVEKCKSAGGSSRLTSYTALSGASTTPLGSCIIASWRRCAGVIVAFDNFGVTMNDEAPVYSID
jgi:hypothetical protein